MVFVVVVMFSHVAPGPAGAAPVVGTPKDVSVGRRAAAVGGATSGWKDVGMGCGWVWAGGADWSLAVVGWWAAFPCTPTRTALRTRASRGRA